MSYRYLIIILFIYLFAGCRNSEVGLPQDCFEMGKAYEELQLLDSASFYYRKAIDLSDANGDNELKGMICNRLGNLFLQADLYEKASDVFDEALKCNVELKDKTSLSKSLRGKGKSLLFRNESDSAINYFMQAYGLIHQIEDTNEVLQINNNLSSIYFSLGQYDKARKYNSKALLLSKDSMDLYRNWFAKVDILIEFQQYDSAWYYLKLANNKNSIQSKTACYSVMYQIAQKQNLPDSSKYLKLYSIYRDSLEQYDQSVRVEAVDHKFLVNRTEKSYESKMRFMFVFFLLCIIILIYLINHHKKRLSGEKEKRMKDTQKNENIILQLHEQMLVLQQKVDTVKDSEKNLSENARKLELLQEAEKNVVKNIMNMAASCSDTFSKSDECKQIKAKLQETASKLNKKERDYIYSVVITKFDPLIQYLSTSMDMNLDDCFLCCLSLAKFTPKESAALRCVSWNAIRSQKSRIKMKFIETFHTLEIYEFIFK